jgi:hypothetical protein
LAEATKNNIQTAWYAHYFKPKTLQEKYQFGYWIKYFIDCELKNRPKSAK